MTTAGDVGKDKIRAGMREREGKEVEKKRGNNTRRGLGRAPRSADSERTLADPPTTN